MSTERTTVAVIGLGIMGAPMAVNLVKAGYDVVGYNRTSLLGAAVAQLMGALRARGHGSLDHSALLLQVEELSGRR